MHDKEPLCLLTCTRLGTTTQGRGQRSPDLGSTRDHPVPIAHCFKVEGAGAHKGDGVLKVVVAHTILVVLEGDHGEGKGSYAAGAPVGQPHLQAHRVAHRAGSRCITVTQLSIYQHICKDTG